ncbi:hypothetical protein [Oligoflexus tunisiensis]|uniref:hypothetical protein n=1 Tax=Oligoflexus tunisiensis TaxID=708132 RepID=UPI00114CDC36|nr:hypothetical protein [Oligoflexus tunisiensis]
MKKLALVILISAVTTALFAGQESGAGPKGKEIHIELTSAEMQQVLHGAFSGEVLNFQKPGLETIKLQAKTFDFESKTVELIAVDSGLRVRATEARREAN